MKSIKSCITLSSRVEISLADKSDTVSVPTRALPRSLEKLVKDQVLDTRFIVIILFHFRNEEEGFGCIGLWRKF